MDFIKGDAVFSADKKYRYCLSRYWNNQLPEILFIMLNPNKADEILNDPSIRRCIGYAKDWGFGSMSVVNLFARRAPYPDKLFEKRNPVGNENDKYILKKASASSIILLAWGNYGSYAKRSEKVLGLLRSSREKLYYLKKTKMGEPGHPLYLRRSLKPKQLGL